MSAPKQEPALPPWTEHHAPLAPGWSIWRQVALRGAGFPAALVAPLRQPESQRAADALLDREEALHKVGHKASAVRAELAQERARLEEALARDAARVSALLADLARLPALREAAAWQNRSVLESAFDILIKRAGAKSTSDTREKEELVAKYLIRYCLKNDTIGFFGPLGWGKIEPDARALSLEPGPHLLAERSTRFEHWAIDTLAARLSSDRRLRPWLAPRRLPFVRVEGTRAHLPLGDPLELGAASARALALCDGERTAREIAAALCADPALGVSSEAEALAILGQHEAQGFLRWALEIPNIEPRPENTLRRLLERIEDPALRAEALAPLDELVARRDAVARSAGDVVALVRALDELNDAFTALTGEKAQRLGGKTYAGRTLVYEDCRRDVALSFGPDLLRGIGPALRLLLESARWFTFEVGACYEAAFEAAFDAVRKGSPAVDFLPFHMSVSHHFPLISHRSGPFLHPEISLPIRAELSRRWVKLLSPRPGERRVQRSSAELAEAVAEAFAAPAPGWPTARYHAPDLMLAAESAEAVCRGDFVAVLGELHMALNSLESPALFFLHPRQEELVAALESDLPRPRIAPAVPKDRATRAAIVPFNRNAVEFLFDATPPFRPAASVQAVSDLVVERAEGGLSVRSRDGAFRCHVMEFYDWLLCIQYAGSLHLLPEEPHSPRVTIDNMVVCRETWRFNSKDLPFIHLKDSTDRYIAARRWAREHGLPDRVFFKATSERKPFFLDLTSPITLKVFSRMARASTEVILSEVLPDTDQLWLTDAQQRKYTSELRMVIVDGRSFSRGAAG